MTSTLDGKRSIIVSQKIFCYYLTYFDRCFNSQFKEGKEQKLALLEDKPKIFWMLLFVGVRDEFEPEGNNALEKYSYCIEFIKYASKYDLADASVAIFDAFSKLLAREERESWFDLEIVYLIFENFPEGHEMRALIAKFAMVTGFFSDPDETLEDDYFYYGDEENSIDGFTAEVLKQLGIHKWSGE